MSARFSAVIVLLIAAVHTSAVEAGWQRDSQGRQLLAEGCPSGCDTISGGCVADSTAGGYKCIKCTNSLILYLQSSTCGCPAGKYAVRENTCEDCSKGSYCLGGAYTGPNNPGMNPCGQNLTTLGRRSTSTSACVNKPGFYFKLDQQNQPSAVECPENTFSRGFRKQRACLPCPPGYVTNGTGSTLSSACVVPAGYFLKVPGQVAPCPPGEYRPAAGSAAACLKCAPGVTTEKEGSASAADCTIVLPTLYPVTMDGAGVSSTQKCPQKFYCPGGKATQSFNPDQPAMLSGTTVEKCGSGMWTAGTGAASASQSMTPPGFKTSDGQTTQCDDGFYRAGWQPADQASNCDACGQGISSEATEQVDMFALDANNTALQPLLARGSADACYIQPGQGMYYSSASGGFRAVNCSNNSYGVRSITYDRASYPCRDCPGGMQTSTLLPNSSAYLDATTGGFTDPRACVTKPGYGSNGRIATKCPAGSFNAGGNYGTCTKCGPGLTTTDDAANQVSAANCIIAAGYGLHGGVIIPCPVGTYARQASNTSAPCTPCPAGKSTAQPGSVEESDCSVCVTGHGGSSCAQCGGPTGASYGPGSAPAAAGCVPCPNMTVGFSFYYMATNQPFAPAAVARAGVQSPADCLAEFAQIVDAAFFLDGANTTVNVIGAEDKFAACVGDCKRDAACQYITFEYGPATCYKRTVSAAEASNDVVAFKAVLTGDVTAASTNRTAKALASGSYTFWRQSGTGIGVYVPAPNGATASVQACLAACDSVGRCAGVKMGGAASASVLSSCVLITGDTRPAQFKRSVTKTVVTQLTVAAAGS